MYCNRYFSDLREVEDEIKELGYQIVAIGADPPDATAASQEKTGYTLLSDADLEVARAFGIAFQMDQATVEKYREYKIALDHSSWRLPVPAVFIIDGEGTILFEHIDPDYSKRLPAELVLAAAKAFQE